MPKINYHAFPGLQEIPKVRADIEDIIAAVSESTDIRLVDIVSDSRVMDIKDARHLLAYFLREKTGLTWYKIGAILNKDHASAIHGHKKVKETRNYDPHLNKHATNILSILGKQVYD